MSMRETRLNAEGVCPVHNFQLVDMGLVVVGSMINCSSSWLTCLVVVDMINSLAWDCLRSLTLDAMSTRRMKY